ncbi:MAG: GntR family transcriptional regulator [Maritimibacter sp.]|nr:GntR family transcriptional regulator [Maritimibacter sp.]
MKADTIYKRVNNAFLDLLDTMDEGDKLPSENMLSKRMGVSRTTIRKVIGALAQQGVIEGEGRNRVVAKPDRPLKRFPAAETVAMSDQIEAMFMKWMLTDDARPGRVINELELARKFKVATTSIREFLNRFQRFGLIERRAYGGWVFKGFTARFAEELFEIREMFELRSARAFGNLPETSPAWDGLQDLRARHLEIMDDIDERFHDFSELDTSFHRFIHASVPNRFIEGFNDINALIFHYHYQWSKRDERQRNEVAIREHLTYIDALVTRNPRIIELACKAHLASARGTLLASIAQDR